MKAATDNERYLCAALTWLRHRFTRLLDAAPSPGSCLSDQKAAGSPTDEETAARAEMSRRAPGNALPELARRMALRPFEADLLLLCVAMEIDPAIGQQCARAQHGGLPYPTFALAAELFDDASWEASSASGRLRRWGLIEVHRSGGPVITSVLRADDTVVDHVKGLTHLDPRLEALYLPSPVADPADMTPSLCAAADRVTDVWRDVAESEPLPVVQLTGPSGASKQMVASWAASRAGLGMVRLSAADLAAAPDPDLLSALWRRDSVMLASCALLDADDLSHLPTAPCVTRFLTAGAGPVLVASREPLLIRGRHDVVVEVDWPTPMEQRALWIEQLPDGCAEMADELAGRFRLDPLRIRRVAGGIGHRDERLSFRRQLWRDCHAITRPRLDSLASWTHPRASWPDLVLPSTETNLLRQIPWHVRHRTMVHQDWGFGDRPSRAIGTPVLFAGASGTGKTLAAEVIATELDAPLCRVDLSTAVSKYIGETEKNLSRLFDAAEESAAVLFFDEADALFGKRSAVRDSHDRYANMETSYLLQRLDRFSGVVILATNMPDSLDEAFLRRMRFVVTFPVPAAAERKRLWDHAFPPQVPLDPSLDLQPLAGLPLTGALIGNIALHAAFAAAAEEGGTELSVRHLVSATTQELRKLGRRPPGRLWPEEAS